MVYMKSRAKYFFLMPGVMWILVFTLFPLLYSLYLSFTNARLGRDTQFIGLQNYANLFSDQALRDAALVSAFLAVGGVTLTMVIGTFIAWLFNHDLPGLKSLRAILTMPLFAAPIALGYMGVVIFNEQHGPINNLIQSFGGQAVQWIILPGPARIAVLLTDTWQLTPFV